MTETECQKLTDLPKAVNVFRGGQQSTIAGWSWTLDKSAAEQFGAENASDKRPLSQPLLVFCRGYIGTY